MTTLDAAGPNAAQIDFWNGPGAPLWVTHQAIMDAQLRPLGDLALDALAPAAGERMIDIGCGCGDTTLELARRVGATGSALGVDISQPMLEVAARRAVQDALPQATFRLADAQTDALPPADGAYSRFGVMFFADPVAAFANLRGALKGGGRLAFVCWRGTADNPWVGIPMATATALLPPAPPPVPGAPSPFAFADRERLHGILTDAGFSDIVITAHDHTMHWVDMEDAINSSAQRGPVAALLRDHPEIHARFVRRLRDAFEPHRDADGVKLGAGVWVVRAIAA